MTPPTPPSPMPTTGYSDGRQSAAAARRNSQPLLHALAPQLTPGSRVLELASGTGEHAVLFNRACPGLRWQPSDIDAERRRSVQAWTVAEQLEAAIAPPLALDVCQLPWPVAAGQWDGVLAVNLLHVMPASGLAALLAGVRTALRPGGWWTVYGPFRRGDEWFSAGNLAFHAQLQAQHPEWGLRDMAELDAMAQAAGLVQLTVTAMPANNHLLSWLAG